METPSWDKSDILLNQTAKFQSLTAFRNWDCKFPKLNASDTKTTFLKKSGIRELNYILGLDQKIINFQRHWEIETKNLFVEEGWILKTSRWPACATKSLSGALMWPSFPLFCGMTYGRSLIMSSDHTHLERKRYGVPPTGVRWTLQRICLRSLLVRSSQDRRMTLNWFER